jgi:hypothetical protein
LILRVPALLHARQRSRSAALSPLEYGMLVRYHPLFVVVR